MAQRKTKLTQLEQGVQNKLRKELGITVPKSKLWRVAIRLEICPRCGSENIVFDYYGAHWHCLVCMKAKRDYMFDPLYK